MGDDLFECPEHRQTFHLEVEPCWQCFLPIMYARDRKNDGDFWKALERARKSWQRVFPRYDAYGARLPALFGESARLQKSVDERAAKLVQKWETQEEGKQHA